MRTIICILAFFVIGEWAVIYFKYNEGGLFHLSLLLALYALKVQLFPNRKILKL